MTIKRKEEDKTELQKIREELGLTVNYFAKRVIKRSILMTRLYERSSYPTPQEVLEHARRWLDFYRKENGSN